MLLWWEVQKEDIFMFKSLALNTKTLIIKNTVYSLIQMWILSSLLGFSSLNKLVRCSPLEHGNDRLMYVLLILKQSSVIRSCLVFQPSSSYITNYSKHCSTNTDKEQLGPFIDISTLTLHRKKIKKYSKNIIIGKYYYQCWKKLCCFIFLRKLW